jgi:type IV secretion system protein VirB5
MRFLPVVVLLAATPLAQAQFAVIDVASLTQLLTQVRTLEQQVATARNQLTQAQTEFQSMTGGRGMEQLLAGVTRNYLPPDWATLENLLQTAANSYPALAADLRSSLSRASVLSAQELEQLGPGAAAELQAGRRSAALLQSLTHQALHNSSARFAALQQLVEAIGRAGDQKAILDLQARIGAEGGMLQNEHTKLELLYQGVQAEQWLAAQRARELTVAGHGRFDSRFQPQP